MPSPPSSFETDGFLSDEIVVVIKSYKAENPKLHDDFRLLGRLAHKSKNSQSVSNQDVQQLMIVLLIGRMLSLYEAIYVLVCRGMKFEHRSMLRIMLEAHLKLQFCVLSRANAEELALSGEHERVRMLVSAAKYRQQVDSPEELKKMAELTAQVKADNKALGVEKLTLREIAERADRLWEYELTYALLCKPTHLDSRDLQSSLDRDSNGNIIGILIGPDHDEAGVSLATAMNYLFQAITNPVVTIIDPTTAEAKDIWASINLHFVEQHALK